MWVLTDEQRRDSLGVYGGSWAKTPFFDELAGSGCVFGNAYTPSPVCAPARASLLTGRSAASLRILNNDDRLPDENAAFLTDRFSGAGYQTASFGKVHYNNAAQAFETQAGRTLGDRVVYDRYLAAEPADAGAVGYDGTVHNWLFGGRFPGTRDDTPEAQNLRDALSFLDDGRDSDRPFFLRLSLNAPHTPVVVPAPYDTLVDPADIEIPLDYPVPPPGLAEHIYAYIMRHAGNHKMTQSQILRARQCYYGTVSMLDDLLREFFEQLERRGLLDNTIIAFVSDHGAHLGDHGFFQKQTYFDAAARVPFFLSGPGVAGGAVLSTPVSTGGLLPTLMELAGIDCPTRTHFPSLAACVGSGREPDSRPVFSEIDFGCWGYRDGDRYAMVRKGRWKLSLFRDDADPDRFRAGDGLMLFDLANDPGERRNLIPGAMGGKHGALRARGSGRAALDDDPAIARVVTELIADLDAWDRAKSDAACRKEADRGIAGAKENS